MEGDMTPGGDRGASRAPHRIPELVLEWLLGPLGGAGESIIGDLRQEHGRMVREAGAMAAARWHWKQSLGIAARAVRDRLRRRGPFRAGGSGPAPGAPRRRNERWDMKEFLAEIRYSIRGLAGARQYAVAAVLTLALAVAANTVVFTVLNSVLLQPLPYGESDRLVILNQTAPGLGYERFGISPGLYHQYREAATLFEESGLFSEQTVNLTGEDAAAERVGALASTHTLFSALGSQPALGRGFTAAEDAPGGPEAVILSHALWQRRYGGDASVIGRTIVVNGNEREVVGVMPESFAFPDEDVALYLPLAMDLATSSPGQFGFNAIARVTPGTTVEQVRLQLNDLIARLPEFYPDAAEFHAFNEQGRLASLAEPLKAAIVGDLQRPLWLLLGTAALVLLIACANVTNLFLVRAEARQRDIAVRSALGAGRLRLTRQFLAESVTLAVAAGVVGVVLGAAGVAGLVRSAPPNLPRLSQIGLDPFVIAYAAGLTGVIAMLLAFVPAIRLTSPSILALVSRSGTRTTVGRDRLRARQALVVVQTALALVLLAGSGLMLRSFAELRALDPGFDPEGVLTFRITLPATTYPDAQSVAFLHDRLLERLRALPGVESAGGARDVPLANSASGTAFAIEDHPAGPGELPPMLWYTYVSEDFFDAMGIAVVAGEVTGASSNEINRRAVVVDRIVADRFWPGQDPIGRRLGSTSPSPLWYTVVGVVEDVRARRLQDEPEGMVYFPLLADVPPPDSANPRPASARSMTYTLRGPRPEALATAVRSAVGEIDPNLPIAAISTMESIIARSMVQTSFTMLALVIAAALALFLGAIGLYGVISYLVTQRTREIGLRMALGAEAGTVRRMVAWQGFRLAIVGLVVGVIAAAILTRLLGSLLYGTSPNDPLTFASVTALLGGVAFLASWLPALRASRLDPARTLQAE
jgi:predicted permease